jgi:hypothetical protein
MTASDATTGGTETSVEAYEELRNHVLSGSSSSSSHSGLVLLRRQGVAAWVAQRSVCADSVQPAAVPDPHAAAPLPSDELHAGIVRVLANMALAGRQEMSA